MSRLNYQIDFKTAVQIAESAIGKGHISSWQRKLGDVIAAGGLRGVLSPYYSFGKFCCVSPDEERESYPVLIELEHSEFLRQIANRYEKVWQAAYDTVKKGFVITMSRARVVVRRKVGSDLSVVELWIYGTTTNSPQENPTPIDACFVYEGTIERADYPTGGTDEGVEEDRIPDVNERSVSAPVYLVPFQNVRSTFGVSVKENPDRIRLMARWAGWSSVKFYGGQVLLIADIAIR